MTSKEETGATSREKVRQSAARLGWRRSRDVARTHDDKLDVFRRSEDVLHVRYDAAGRCVGVRVNGTEYDSANRNLVLDVLK